MKTKEAPEKIYVKITHPISDEYTEIIAFEDGDGIEYTRTDAFIEKVLSWLKNHYRDYMYNPTGKRLEGFFGIDMCNDFENYIKGE